MKVKKHIGETIEGFTILGTRKAFTKGGKVTSRIRLRCEDCGREFERCSGADFTRIKCKCQPPKPWIVWEGVEYTQKDFCKANNISTGMLTGRLKNGQTIEEAIIKDVEKECPVCGNTFIRKELAQKYCSKDCAKKAYLKGNRHHIIEWHGKKYTQTDFCKLHNINPGTFASRIKIGMSIEDAIKHEFENECEICGKVFVSTRPNKKYCCHTCARRGAKHRGAYKQPSKYNCVVCGKEFESIREDAKTCSDLCRRQLTRIDRNGRYNTLKKIGHFDYSVTLQRVFDKYNGICQKCGKQLNFDCDFRSDDYPSIDHIKPLSKGGFHEWDNVQLLCRHCNFLKGTKTE